MTNRQGLHWKIMFRGIGEQYHAYKRLTTDKKVIKGTRFNRDGKLVTRWNPGKKVRND